MLSFDKGDKIATVTNTKTNESIDIFVTQKSKEPDIDLSLDELISLISDEDFRSLSKTHKANPVELQFLRENLSKHNTFNDKIKTLFDNLIDSARSKLKYELKFGPDHDVSVFFDTSKHVNMFISGASGTGKTYFMVSILKNCDKDIYYVSPTESEGYIDVSLKPLLDKPNFNRLSINSATDINKLPSMKNIANKIFVFDDLDTAESPELLRYLMDYRNYILNRGRHTNTNVIVISHDLRAWANTKVPRRECRLHVLFPADNKHLHDEYLVQMYKLPIALRKKIFEHTDYSRWMVINNKQPNFILMKKLILLF